VCQILIRFEPVDEFKKSTTVISSRNFLPIQKFLFDAKQSTSAPLSCHTSVHCGGVQLPLQRSYRARHQFSKRSYLDGCRQCLAAPFVRRRRHRTSPSSEFRLETYTVSLKSQQKIARLHFGQLADGPPQYDGGALRYRGRR
jgi:hypothetical protein